MFLFWRCCIGTEKYSPEDYPDFEEIHIQPDIDGFEDRRENKDTQKAFVDELSNRALEAAGRSDKVVIRYVTTSSQDCQESLVKRLIQSGASNENITVVRLAMDHSNKTHRNGSFYRTNYCTWRPKSVLA
jgi:hypothetical protein